MIIYKPCSCHMRWKNSWRRHKLCTVFLLLPHSHMMHLWCHNKELLPYFSSSYFATYMELFVHVPAYDHPHNWACGCQSTVEDAKHLFQGLTSTSSFFLLTCLLASLYFTTLLTNRYLLTYCTYTYTRYVARILL